MSDIGRLFQAFLAPAIFVSATALLILSINVRLMGIVSRLRQFAHARHSAAKSGRAQEAEAYSVQIESVERRAEKIRRCFLLALVALAGTIASCLLLGIGLYIKQAALVAVIVFVLALICLLAATIYYACEVRVALSSVQEEARDVRFMDLGAHREHQHPDTV
jgi:amino acid permease